MARNLDMTALRAFATVAEAGGVTKAAGLLNLTQSAVSMQVKRLEDSLGLALFQRDGRSLSLTAKGDELLSYARRILALNDEVWGRLSSKAYTGELRIGVPHDIVYPHIPGVLQQFAAEACQVKVQLHSENSEDLLAAFDRGEYDLIMTTEQACGAGGEILCQVPLVWVGASGGTAWQNRPLRLAFENRCIFRHIAQSTLDEADITWEMSVESCSSRTIDATISADLAVNVAITGAMHSDAEEVRHDGALPALPMTGINMYVTTGPNAEMANAFGDLVRARYACAISSAAAA